MTCLMPSPLRCRTCCLQPRSDPNNPASNQAVRFGLKPANEILTITDYRQRYALYRTDSSLQVGHTGSRRLATSWASTAGYGGKLAALGGGSTEG